MGTGTGTSQRVRLRVQPSGYGYGYETMGMNMSKGSEFGTRVRVLQVGQNILNFLLKCAVFSNFFNDHAFTTQQLLSFHDFKKCIVFSFILILQSTNSRYRYGATLKHGYGYGYE